MSPRVALTFDGDPRGAVNAARQVRSEVEKTARTTKQTAASTVAARAKERQNLASLVSEYRTLAREAKRGSAEQVAAIKLATEAEHRLGVEQRRTAGYFAGYGRSTRNAGDELNRFGRGAIAGSGIVRSLGRQVAFASGTFLGGAGLVAAISSTVTKAADLQTELATLKVVTGANAATMAEASRKAIALGNDLTIPNASAADGAQAMTELAKAGLDVQESMDAARGTLQLATAAQTDNGTAAKIVGQALNAFALEGRDAVTVADLLAGAANASTGEIQDFALGLQQSSASAHAAGLTIEETVSALGALADAGVVGSDAGTSLRVMLQRLNPQTGKAAELVKNLGLNVYDSAGRMKPLREIVSQYHDVLVRLNPQQRSFVLQTIFGQDASRAANILLGQSVEQYDRLTRAVTKHGQASTLAGARTKGYNGAVAAFQNAVETLQVVIGQEFLPGMTKGIKRLADWVSNAAESERKTHKFGDAVKGIIGTLRQGAAAVKAVVDELHGWKNTLELILAFKVATVLTGWGTAFRLFIGSEAAATGVAGAAGTTGLLNARLKLLRTLTGKPFQFIVAYEIIKNITGSNADLSNDAGGPGDLQPVFRGGHWVDPLTGATVSPRGAAQGGARLRVGKGVGIAIPTTFTPTHETRGLPGFPAVDIMGAPGTPILAPEDGQITRVGGHEPSEAPPQGQGGPWGLSLYYLGGETGNTYYMTHLVKVGVVGAYSKGDVIGIIGNYPGSPADHVHVGRFIGSAAAAYQPSSKLAAGDFDLTGAAAGTTTTRDKARRTTRAATAATATPIDPRLLTTTGSGSKRVKLTADIRTALGRAAGTAALDDDITAAQRAIAYLRQRLESTTDKDVRADLQTAIGKYQKAIAAARKRLVSTAATAAGRRTTEAGISRSFATGRAAAEQAFALDLLPADQESKLRMQIGRFATLTRQVERNGKISPAELSRVKASWSALSKGIADASRAVADETKRIADDRWSGITSTISRAIAETWQTTVRDFGRETDRGVQEINSKAASDILAMSRAFQKQLDAFDRETQAGLDALVVGQTPAEKLLADRAAARAAQDLEDRLAADRAKGDTVAVAQDLYDIETASLEAQAAAERKATDKQTEAAQAVYQAQRDDLRQGLEDDEAAREDARQKTADADAQAYQDRRDAQLQALQDLHDDQTTALENDLVQWGRWLANKQRSYADFLTWIAQNPISNGLNGLGPGPFDSTGGVAETRTIVRAGQALAFQGGGTVPRRGRWAGMRDSVMVRATGGEEMVDTTTAAALRRFLSTQSGGAGSLAGARIYVLGTTEKEVARALARLTGPERDRTISYLSER